MDDQWLMIDSFFLLHAINKQRRSCSALCPPPPPPLCFPPSPSHFSVCSPRTLLFLSFSFLTLRPDVSSAGSLSCDGVFAQRSFMVRFFSGRRGDSRRSESALLRQVRRQRRTPKGERENEKDGGGRGVRRRTTARFRWERKDRKTLFTQTVSTVSFRSTTGRDRGGMPLKA